MTAETLQWKQRWTQIVRRIRIVHTPADEKILLDELLTQRVPCVLGFVNAHALNSATENTAFFDALNSADLLLRDGSGMALMFRKQACEPGLNMNGTDFIPKILAAFQGRRVALWGTQQAFLVEAAGQCMFRFGVEIVSLEHGFKKPEDYAALAKGLSPDLIVLGMGMPKQEQVAQLIRARVSQACLIVCGGAVIDFLGGKIARAPVWMHHLGIEWLYRLMREPKRLCKRYLIGNPLFIYRVLVWGQRKCDESRLEY